jgi:hypothetical protein
MKTYIRNRNPPSFFVGTKDTTVCCVIHNKKSTLTFQLSIMTFQRWHL